MSFIDTLDINEMIQDCICKTQANIYSYANNHGYDMQVFSKKYLASDFCNTEMDAEYSVYQMADVEECMDFINEEISVPTINEVQYNEDAIWWIGYIYRALHLYSKLSSKELGEKIPFQNMLYYYLGLSMEDYSMALDIIAEDFLGKERPKIG